MKNIFVKLLIYSKEMNFGIVSFWFSFVGYRDGLLLARLLSDKCKRIVLYFLDTHDTLRIVNVLFQSLSRMFIIIEYC
jgi:hypothetical protein